MASLLIAGYGFLGKSLEREFSRAGWSVEKLNRSGTQGAIPCDISSTENVSALPGEYDLVIHCAASGGGGEDGYKKVYLEGCRNLLEKFHASRFIFISSTSVYAQADHALVTEESPAEPSTPPAKILREAENLTLESGGVVARLSALYGPGRCHILKNFLSGTVRLDTMGERIMNFIHGHDAARALLLLACEPRAIYNITAEPVNQRDLYASLAEHFNKPMPPTADNPLARKRGASSKRVSNAKLKTLGWQPQYENFLTLALSCDLER